VALPAQKDNNTYTYAEYLMWSEDERWELLDGVAYNIAAPSRRHQEVSGELFYQSRSTGLFTPLIRRLWCSF
jgi:hypothetical protein